MIITNFFTKEQEVVLGSLLYQTHGELEERFEKLFKLDVFPGLTLDFNFDAAADKQPLIWLGTELRIDEKERIKSIIADEIVFQVVHVYSYAVNLGFERLLDDVQFQVMFKEYASMLMMYQLIKAHSIKYEFDRFIGEDALKPQSQIMKPLLDMENELHFYKALRSFYAEKLPENIIGKLFVELNFEIINHLEKNNQSAGVNKNTSVINVVWEIISELKKQYPSE